MRAQREGDGIIAATTEDYPGACPKDLWPVERCGEFRMFGEERLTGILENPENRTAAEIHRSVLEALEPYEKPDDVTLVVMRWLE